MEARLPPRPPPRSVPPVRETIIVGYDGRRPSGDAVRLAAELALVTDARLLAVRVCDRQPLQLRRDGRYEAALRDELAVLHEQLGPVFDVLGAEHDPQLLAVPAVGAARGLDDLAEREGASAIVLGSSQRGRLGRVLAGSTGELALADAPCGVAVAPYGYATHPGAGLRTIGVALDGTDACEPALDEAMRLAELSGAELVAFSARTKHPGLERRRSPELAEREERLEQLLDGPLAGNVRRVVVMGRPARALADAARGVDLLVMGSRAGGPAGRAAAGGVARELLRSAPVPVLVVPARARVPA